MSVDAVVSVLGPQSTVRDLLVVSATGHGIDVAGGSGCHVDQNQVSGGVNAGVYIGDNAVDTWVTDNQISGVAGDGVEAAGGTANVDRAHITGNTIDCSVDGVSVNAPTSGTSTNHVVTGNIVTGSHTNGVNIAAGVVGAVVCSNVSSGHSGSAIVDNGTDTSICVDQNHTHTGGTDGSSLWPDILLATGGHGVNASRGIVTGGGASDHGGLTGLGDDDHTHYFLTDGSRTLTGDLNLGGNTLIGPLDPTGGTHVGDRDYNDARYVYLAETNDQTMAGDLVFPETEGLRFEQGAGSNFFKLASFTDDTLHVSHSDGSEDVRTLWRANGDIDFWADSGGATLSWDESADQWEFKKPVVFEAAVTGIAHSEIETVAADDHHTEPPHHFLLMGG